MHPGGKQPARFVHRLLIPGRKKKIRTNIHNFATMETLQLHGLLSMLQQRALFEVLKDSDVMCLVFGEALLPTSESLYCAGKSRRGNVVVVLDSQTCIS